MNCHANSTGNSLSSYSYSNEVGGRSNTHCVMPKEAEQIARKSLNDSTVSQTLQVLIPKFITPLPCAFDFSKMSAPGYSEKIELSRLIKCPEIANTAVCTNAKSINQTIKAGFGLLVMAWCGYQLLSHEQGEGFVLNHEDLKPLVIAALTEAGFESYQGIKNKTPLRQCISQAFDAFNFSMISSLISKTIAHRFNNAWTMQRVLVCALAGGATSVLSNQDFLKGFMSKLVIAGLTLANVTMRNEMIQQSSLNPDNIGKPSQGLFNDGIAIAGTRRVVNPDFQKSWFAKKYLPCDGPAGGCQGVAKTEFGDKGSRIGPIDYKPGSLLDAIAESFAGPHDWLSNAVGMYEKSTGNAVHRTGANGLVYEVLSYLLLIPSLPFALAAFSQNSSLTTHLVQMNIK